MHNLQTRSEHSRSMEDAERFKALKVLTDLGLLLPVAELETFHGRVRTDDDQEPWAVDPGFTNGGNDTGNSNVYARPSLYTADEETAQEFADMRIQQLPWSAYRQTVLREVVRTYTDEQRQEWLDRLNKRQLDDWSYNQKYNPDTTPDNPPIPYDFEKLDEPVIINLEVIRIQNQTPDDENRSAVDKIRKSYTTELHRIVSDDPDATILDISFDFNSLSEQDTARYRKAMMALRIPLSEGSPVNFEARDQLGPLLVELRKRGLKDFIKEEDIQDIAEASGVDTATVLQIVGAFNVQLFSAYGDPTYLPRELLKNASDAHITDITINGEILRLPINFEFLQRYLQLAHIVGIQQVVTSTTINKLFPAVSFFDLEKTLTKDQLASRREKTQKTLGGLASSFSDRDYEKTTEPLVELLQNPYAKPEQLIAMARKIEGYDELFDAPAGNWEGFSLAEHTETVLRNFDENFVDKIPVQLIASMRLAILVHDMGKPAAAANRERHKQKEYNREQASDFLNKIGVKESLANLVIAMITDGEGLASQVQIRNGGQPAVEAMREFAVKTLKEFYDSDKVDDAQIESFVEMCKMLQLVDGGAYTSMAITSRKDGTGRYRNAPSFNGTFEQPVDMSRRLIKLKKSR